MAAPFRILEISIPNASSSGTFRDAMHLPQQMAGDGFHVAYVLPWMKVNRTLSSSPYAIVNHMEVNETLGTLADAQSWISACHDAGLRVILDLPLNHTSPTHTWTTQRHWYSKTKSGDMHPPTGSNWNDVVQLNHDCEGVKLACIEVMDFWLDMGVDGFRLDAACYMPDEFVDGIISRIRQARSHVLFWGDGEYYAGARSAFDAWFHHEAFSLAKHDLNAWKSLIRSHRGNGIYYLTNHDTLRCGVSPVSEWDGAYCALKDLLGMSDQHVMQSWSEWRDPSTSYSFLL